MIGLRASSNGRIQLSRTRCWRYAAGESTRPNSSMSAPAQNARGPAPRGTDDSRPDPRRPRVGSAVAPRGLRVRRIVSIDVGDQSACVDDPGRHGRQSCLHARSWSRMFREPAVLSHCANIWGS